MSVTSDAVEILISAKDDASKKFGDVGDAADKFRARLQELNNALSAGGVAKLAGPLTSIATKLGAIGIAGKALKWTLDEVFTGAAGEIRQKWAEPLAQSSVAIENLKGGLRGVGASIASAFADSNFGQYAKLTLQRFNGSLSFNTGSQANFDKGVDERDPGFGTRNRDKLRQSLEQNQSAIQAEEANLAREKGKRYTGLNGRPQLTQEEELSSGRLDVLRKENARLQGLLAQKSRDVKNFPALGALGKTQSQVNNGLAAAFGSGKLRGESPFTTEFGQAAGGMFDAFKSDADAQLKKQLNLESRRAQVIEQTLTPQERFNNQLKELAQLFPRGGEIFDRATAAAAKQRDDVIARANPVAKDAAARALGDNGAISSRFGGGVVKEGPEAKLLKDISTRLAWFQQRAQNEKRDRDGRVKERGGTVRVGLLDGGGF